MNFAEMFLLIMVSVSVINLAFGSTDNSYLNLDNSGYHKNLIPNNCLLYDTLHRRNYFVQLNSSELS
jgi:hypothetical protein